MPIAIGIKWANFIYPMPYSYQMDKIVFNGIYQRLDKLEL